MTDKLKYFTDKVEKAYSGMKELEQEVKEYCKNKRFRIVKNIYYSGYQNNLKGRECIIHPFVFYDQLLFTCTVYNKKTKQIDIKHRYGYTFDYYKEI